MYCRPVSFLGRVFGVNKNNAGTHRPAVVHRNVEQCRCQESHNCLPHKYSVELVAQAFGRG